MTNKQNESISFKRALGRMMKSVPRGGLLWENARFVLADVPVDRDEVNKMLPLCMRASDEAKATIFIVDYTKTSFTVPYQEAAVLIHVKTPLGKGLHCPGMVVNDDTALIYGREFLGYPKKAADIIFEEKDENIKASVTRRGVEVLRIESKSGSLQPSPEPVFDYKTFNVGAGLQLAGTIMPIWLFRPKEIIHESYETEAKVTINASDYDPISRMLIGEPTNTRMVVLDIPADGKYMLPVGAAGFLWYVRTFYMRNR